MTPQTSTWRPTLWAFNLLRVGLLVIVAVLLGCSLLNDRRGPNVTSCEELNDPTDCEDDVIADCTDGQLTFQDCAATGRVCFESMGIYECREPGVCEPNGSRCEVPGPPARYNDRPGVCVLGQCRRPCGNHQDCWLEGETYTYPECPTITTHQYENGASEVSGVLGLCE